MHGKKGATIVTVLFILAPFLIIWALVLAPQLNYWGQVHVTQNHAVGLEAFLYTNINLFIMIAVVAFTAVGIYVTGGGE